MPAIEWSKAVTEGMSVSESKAVTDTVTLSFNLKPNIDYNGKYSLLSFFIFSLIWLVGGSKALTGNFCRLVHTDSPVPEL